MSAFFDTLQKFHIPKVKKVTPFKLLRFWFVSTEKTSSLASIYPGNPRNAIGLVNIVTSQLRSSALSIDPAHTYKMDPY